MGATIRSETHRKELLVVLAMTAIGGMFRIRAPAKLGLIHFDEGIYALAGLWPMMPKGFWGIDPTVIAYAPGGYPFLTGLTSYLVGVGDLTPILVSVLMGTLTIPLVAWLSWRTFGPTAGAITATFAAFSGFHIAFSRMALTDVSFLFFFLLALGLCQRFLEKPNVFNTIGLGIGVGLAQWFKYHGWLAGAIVALTALLNALLDPAERKPKRLLAVWGQGACAGLIAFAVFWPWFSFVESHGGYASLLRHHASYMQGFGHWFANFRIQLDEAAMLGQGSENFVTFKCVAIFFTLYLVGNNWNTSAPFAAQMLGPGATIAMPGSLIFAMSGTRWGWVLGLPMVPFLLRERAAKAFLIGVWWLVFSLLTPLYHPYSRLWLPLESCGWIVLSYCLSLFVMAGHRTESSPSKSPLPSWWFVASVLLVGSFLLLTHPRGRLPDRDGSSLNSSDSLRIACRQVQADLPKNFGRLKLLGRPPITFYLGTAGISLAPQPDLNTLLKAGTPTDWALVDDALLRQEPEYARAKARLTENWELVKQYPTALNLPTLLDLNPGAARGTIMPADLECPLWLLRPRLKVNP